MSELIRFGVSLEKELLDRFDRLCAAKNCPSRSEAIRDLFRAELQKNDLLQPERETAGTLTLLYNHQHGSDLTGRLVELQHAFHSLILSSLHAHLDAHLCLEVIILKGPAGRIRQLADHLSAVKGVLHGELSLAAPGHANPEEGR